MAIVSSNPVTQPRRTTGQHPGGMIVVPPNMDIFDFTPMQYPANKRTSGIQTTHFDFHAIQDSLVKLDNLGHDSPTMARMLEQYTGVPFDSVPLDDAEAMKLFSNLGGLGVSEEQINTSIGTLAIPEFGTDFTRQVLLETQPRTFADLVAIMGLTHGTDVWLNNAQVLIRENVISFSEVIACRGDIMLYLANRGLDPSDAFRIMDRVRKGRGLSDSDVQLMQENAIPDWYMKSCLRSNTCFPRPTPQHMPLPLFGLPISSSIIPLPFTLYISA